jgi:hypothetical protein
MKEPIQWDKWLCRASGINKMMSNGRGNEPLTEKQDEALAELYKKHESGKITEKQKLTMAALELKDQRSKLPTPGDNCISFLLEEYAWITEKKFSISKEFSSPIRKGRICEAEGRGILSYVDDYYYEKNEQRLYNEFLSGEPDTWKGESVHNAEEIPDIKIIFDYPGFLNKIVKPMEPDYADQLRGYATLSGAKKVFRANALVTTPASIREGMKMKLFYQRDYTTPEAIEFLEEWAPIEQAMIFDSIAFHKRLHKLYVDPFTKTEEYAIYERVKICREWLANFHIMYNTLNT